MKSLSRAFFVWVILGGCSWSLATGGRGDLAGPVAGSVLLVLLSTAIWLTAIAALGERPASYGRTFISTITVAAWVATLVIVEGRIEAHPDEKQTLLVTCGLAALLAVGVAMKTRLYPRWSTLRGMAITLAIPTIAGGIFLWRYEAKTKSIAARAEARWSEIGMPLSELEKTLVAGHENGGSGIFRKVLREETASFFYKFGTLAAAREAAMEKSQSAELLIRQAVDLLGIAPPADDIDFSAQRTDRLDAMVPVFDANYRQILDAEPPTWAIDPRDGYNMSESTGDPHDNYDANVPNFLGIRRFAQVTAADALRRFSVGDQAGAALALSAGMHITAGLRQRPTIVSLMISIAVDALLSEKRVRLPASSEDGFPAIAHDAEEYRAEFLQSLQLEAWTALRFTDQVAEFQEVNTQPLWRFLPRWVKMAVARPMARREAAIAALNDAEHTAILKSPASMSLPDFGWSLQDAISSANPSKLECNVTRAMMRIHATLLLREQTELIRNARARLAAGRPLEGRDSVVLPHTRWELTTDSEKSSVSTRLVNAPEWIVKGVVTPKEFWTIPVDGSVAWKFHQPAKTTQQ